MRRKGALISIHCRTTAIARKKTTAALLLMPIAKGVPLVELELRVHSNSRGETTGMTSPTKAESSETKELSPFPKVTSMTSALTV